MGYEPEGRFRDLGAVPSRQPATERPTFEMTLRPEPGVHGIRALKALLKVSLRRYGLRCISLKETGVTPDTRR